MLSLAATAASHGFQVATHAIGDAANAQIIGVYEQLSKKYGSDRRWRIEHFQIVDPVDIPRLAPAGIIASMQPTPPDQRPVDGRGASGAGRLAGTYAWRSVLKSGARLAFGTDFPVENPNPFPGLAAAVCRQDMNGQPPGGWIPAERQALHRHSSPTLGDRLMPASPKNKIGALEPAKMPTSSWLTATPRGRSAGLGADRGLENMDWRQEGLQPPATSVSPAPEAREMSIEGVKICGSSLAAARAPYHR